MQPFPPYPVRPPNPPGITFPFDIAADLESYMDGLTKVTVNQIEPDTLAVLQTATNVTCLKKITGFRDVGTGEGGEVNRFNMSQFRLWAKYVPWMPKERDQIIDAEGITWWVGVTVDLEAFGVAGAKGFYICRDCVEVR